MGNVSFEKTIYTRGAIPLESNHSFSFRHSRLYASMFKKFAGAIVPNDCYVQTITTGREVFQICNALLPVDPNLSRCHKFLWSAKHGCEDDKQITPDTLEIFIVLTCIEMDKRGIGEEKVCDILFPGSWALLLWQKHLCLWYGRRQLLKTNPNYSQTGLMYAGHENLDLVLSDCLAITQERGYFL